MEHPGLLRNGYASVGLAALWTGTYAPLVQPSVSTLLSSTRGKVLLPGHLLLGHLSAALLEVTLLLREAPLE